MAGFDAVVVKGKAPYPVYLWIKDGQYELRDASRYWGMGTGTFEDTIQAELGDSADVRHHPAQERHLLCLRCSLQAGRRSQGARVEGRYGGPEYENLATLDSYCKISDLDRVALANQICNQEGMDPIAVGATIGWAMDAFARGEITLADTGGMPIHWGDAETMVKLTEMIATRDGFGDVLAEGMNGASQKLGGKGAELITAVKGNALPAHMPQVKRSLALIYAVNPFGADHQSSEHDPGYAPDSDEESLRRLALLGLTDPQDPLNLSDE